MIILSNKIIWGHLLGNLFTISQSLFLLMLLSSMLELLSKYSGEYNFSSKSNRILFSSGSSWATCSTFSVYSQYWEASWKDYCFPFFIYFGRRYDYPLSHLWPFRACTSYPDNCQCDGSWVYFLAYQRSYIGRNTLLSPECCAYTISTSSYY